MSYQKNNNRHATKITINEENKIVLTSDRIASDASDEENVFEFRLEQTTIAENFGWAFYTFNDSCLYAPGGGNYLKTKPLKSANDLFTISIDDGSASVESMNSVTQKYMRFNYNNGTTIFSCYSENSSLQDPVYLYKLVEPETPTEKPKFTTQSIVLSGQIGVNFFMNLNGLTEEQRAASYVEFSIAGKNGGTQTAAYDPDNMNKAGTYYKFTCRTNSVQMADRITAVYHYKDADGTEQTVATEYTVETYLNAFSESSGEELYDLIKAINDYGYYAQQYLSKHAKTPWTLGTDHAAMAKVNTTEYSYTADDLAAYKIVKDLNVDLAKVTYSLTLDADTAVNLYILPAEGYDGSVAVRLKDGTVLTPVKTGDRYRVTIGGISAHLLGNMYEVTITTASGASTVQVSALSYAYASIGDNAEAKNAMSALYDYYLKAIAYQEKLNSQNNG